MSDAVSADTRLHGIVASVPAEVKTTVTELGDSRVRLQVEVPAGELEGRLAQKARQLGRELKLPGFRRGKVPAPLVIQRIGREVVLEEAVRDTLSSWYSAAIETSGIVPVGDPHLDLGELPPQDLDPETVRRIEDATRKIGNALNVTGPYNIQFIAKDNEIKVIECNSTANNICSSINT